MTRSPIELKRGGNLMGATGTLAVIRRLELKPGSGMSARLILFIFQGNYLTKFLTIDYRLYWVNTYKEEWLVDFLEFRN